MTSRIATRVRDYYEDRLRVHGATPAGVDWNSRDSQELRFAQLALLWRDEADASVLDYGCGYGALAGWLRARGHAGPYMGFDVSAKMAETARRETAAFSGCFMTSDRAALAPADYTVASGIFNVKLDTPVPEWRAYVLETLDDLASLGRRGFAFNALTVHSDVDRQRPDLYYADPVELVDHCLRSYSRSVALLHDYPLYEFTVLVRLSGSSG